MKHSSRIRVAASQYFVRPISSFDGFQDQVTAVVRSAASYRSRLLVLPEYFTMQLFSLFDPQLSIDQMVRASTAFVPRYVELFSRLARENGLYIVAGTIPTLDPETGKVHNDAHLFAPSGEHGVQGKLHMTRFEKEEWIVHARNRLRIFDTDLGKIAIAICYDVEFPELVRAAAHEGAHILAVPSNTDDRQGYLRVRYCAHARTIENQMYVIHTSTVGGLPRVPDVSLNYGKASILTPCDFPFHRDGILAEGNINQEGMIIGELDLELIEESRTFGTVLPLKDSKHTKALISHIDSVSL